MSQHEIKLVAVDVDGTFVRADYSFDRPRFERILSRMNAVGCRFVVASGNQYYQLRDLFPEQHHEFAFVAENGAYIVDEGHLVFAVDMPREVVKRIAELCYNYPEVQAIISGVECAYCQRVNVSSEFFELAKVYYHRLKWVDDLSQIDDQFLKVSLLVPDEKTSYFYNLLCQQLNGIVDVTTSGHGWIDLIMPGCHKASGLAKLVQRWRITPEQCVSFGDGGNDIEMLKYCGRSYAMQNAPENVKEAAKFVCPSNEEDGVLEVLDELF
ncbi:MAG: HAD family hydrolase [Enterococcus cecorum]|nr:HAD family hydrolase [Enterococcus cecorum]